MLRREILVRRDNSLRHFGKRTQYEDPMTGLSHVNTQTQVKRLFKQRERILEATPTEQTYCTEDARILCLDE